MINYAYKNCPVPGGGFVTGFIFNPSDKECLYARTDIGGTYHYDFTNERWVSLIDHVTAEDISETYPLSIAVDENKRDSLYIACGDGKSGRLCVSKDGGVSFLYYSIPCSIHGNMPGRATGERLIVRDKEIWFGSQSEGLLYSENGGMGWQKLDVCTENNSPEKNITVVWENSGYDRIKGAGDILIVGCSGGANPSETNVRGCTAYIFNKESKRFQELPYPPPIKDKRCVTAGFVPQRCCSDGEYLYITYTAAQNSNSIQMANYDLYTCDSGGCFDGRLYRYKIEKGNVTEVKDITPIDVKNDVIKINGGLGGIAYADGLLVCSSLSHKKGDRIWCSKDKGNSWDIILKGLEKGKIDFNVPYMNPKYNGNGSLIHWISDLKISPFNSDFMVFNTGTGIFATNNLSNAKIGKEVDFRSICDGLEETVHLNVYSLPHGEVKVMDIIGDLGGFAFTDLDKPCENSFADDKGNRWITCLNGDFVEKQAEIVVATPRGNWMGKTKGGVIISYDQCKTWKLLPYPWGITSKIDFLMENIQRPNIDSGWTAITADAQRIIWTISSERKFLNSCTVFTDDVGETWHKSIFLNKDNKEYKTEFSVKIFSDRLDSDILYAFGESSRFFVSRDKGATFIQKEIENFPKDVFKLRSQYQIQPEFSKSGMIWLALDKYGLYKLSYNKNTDTLNAERVTGEAETVQCVGLGISFSDGKTSTLYITGRINGEYGFYRSVDEGKSWERINNDNQMFGQIIAISGDRRTKGRFYLATGSKGLIYGEEI